MEEDCYIWLLEFEGTFISFIEEEDALKVFNHAKQNYPLVQTILRKVPLYDGFVMVGDVTS